MVGCDQKMREWKGFERSWPGTGLALDSVGDLPFPEGEQGVAVDREHGRERYRVADAVLRGYVRRRRHVYPEQPVVDFQP